MVEIEIVDLSSPRNGNEDPVVKHRGTIEVDYIHEAVDIIDEVRTNPYQDARIITEKVPRGMSKFTRSYKEEKK